MTDVHDKMTRSYNMSQIRSENTKPEIIVRKFLFANGFRFRLHDKSLPGKPDIVLPKYKIVIFVNGCFWHQHLNCYKSHLPKTNIKYWKNKLNSNLIRDLKNIKLLKKLKLKVFVIWECEIGNGIKNKKFIDFIKKIKSNQE